MPDVIDWFGTGRDAGEYSFLSNFFDVPEGVIFGGVVYPTSEHGYQAAKTLDQSWRLRIHDAPSPRTAKRIGRLQSLPLRPDWEKVKEPIMGLLLDRKFSRPWFAKALLATGDAELIEGNTWHDNTWGDCRCKSRPDCSLPGLNLLGRGLMRVRSEVSLEYA